MRNRSEVQDIHTDLPPAQAGLSWALVHGQSPVAFILAKPLVEGVYQQSQFDQWD